jgi:hypothetical protein
MIRVRTLVFLVTASIYKQNDDFNPTLDQQLQETFAKIAVFRSALKLNDLYFIQQLLFKIAGNKNSRDSSNLNFPEFPFERIAMNSHALDSSIPHP